MPEMKILSTAETVSRLKEAGFRNMNLPLLYAGLQQRIYPFGNAIKLSEWVYVVYEPLLDKWINERAV